jgi:euchromatic histone-lysine N-methyltransferase
MVCFICRNKLALIIYLRVGLPMVSHGGREKNSSRQIYDQKLEALALERNALWHRVRVIRGMKYERSASGSSVVYISEGLYRIINCRFEVGKSGFGVYKYKLSRMEGQSKLGSVVLKEARDIKKSGLDFKPISFY